MDIMKRVMKVEERLEKEIKGNKTAEEIYGLLVEIVNRAGLEEEFLDYFEEQ